MDGVRRPLSEKISSLENDTSQSLVVNVSDVDLMYKGPSEERLTVKNQQEIRNFQVTVLINLKKPLIPGRILQLPIDCNSRILNLSDDHLKLAGHDGTFFSCVSISTNMIVPIGVVHIEQNNYKNPILSEKILQVNHRVCDTNPVEISTLMKPPPLAYINRNNYSCTRSCPDVEMDTIYENFNREKVVPNTVPFELPSSNFLKNKNVEINQNIEIKQNNLNFQNIEPNFVTNGSLEDVFMKNTVNNESENYCFICKKNFRGKFELNRHDKSIHQNIRQFSCRKCPHKCRDRFELKRHYLTHSFNKKNATGIGNVQFNLHPGLFFNNEDRVLTNAHDTNDFVRTSNKMEGETLSDEDEKLDESKCMQIKSQSSFCGVCGKSFRGINEFKRHFSVVHQKKYRYKCIECSKLWRDQYDLKRHLRRSHFSNQNIDKEFLKRCLLDQTSLTFEKESVEALDCLIVSKSDGNAYLKSSSVLGKNTIPQVSNFAEILPNRNIVKVTTNDFPLKNDTVARNYLKSMEHKFKNFNKKEL